MQLFDKGKEVVHLIGWQEKVNGSNVQCLSFVFEDGHVEVRDGFKEDHIWFSPVVFRDEEKIE